MADPAQGGDKRRKSRKATEATVTARRQISPDLVRLSLSSPGLKGRDLEFTDHYIKILFVPEKADYSWPFDLAEVRENKPRDEQPQLRTYTLINFDKETGNFDVDFVTHGDSGLAGPWARDAKVGESFGFAGPGGAWRPEESYEHFVMAGDESAAPAISAGLAQLPAGMTATAYIEVENEDAVFEIATPANAELNWVYRNGATHGTELSRAVREAGVPKKKTSWFIHGVAEMIKEMRRFLFVDSGIEKSDVSISGYWRIGMTENEWQASKHDFVEEMESEESQAAS